MRMLRALRDFFSDLGQGDPIALALAGFFLLLTAAVTAIWIAELRRRRKESKDKKPGTKGKPKIPGTPKS